MRHPLALLASLSLLGAGPASAQTVVLDPGHGGADPGAVGCMGLEEAPVVLDVAQRTQALLEAEGLNVELTRTDDRSVSLSARVSFANGLGADLFVAIHSNANGGTPASGTETWIANAASSTSATMAGHLQREMVDAWGLPDRGVKRQDFTVIATTRMPAALTELAFTNRCDPDAALLRDPAARAEMAEAHARAVLLTLGRDPGGVGTDPPPAGTGTLRGVVFEDVGAGLEDTTRRLDTATVLVNGAAATVDASTAHFRVVLAPGAYEVRASAAGFTASARTCTVTAGAETWCSVGLMPEGEPPPPGVDAGPPPGEVDAGSPPIEVDAGSPPLEVDGGAPPGPPGTERPGGTAGCSVGARGAGSPPWPLALLGLLALARRRGGPRRERARERRAKGALLGVTGLVTVLVAGCGEAPAAATPTALGELTAPAAETAAATIVRAHEVPAFAHLEDLTPIATGLVEPVLSPDGAHLAMVSPDHTQLWLASHGQAPELVAEGPRVGFRPTFHGGALRYRHPQQSPTAIPHYALPLEDGAAPPLPAPARHLVRLDEEHRVLLAPRGGVARVISPEGDRVVLAALSPDERHVVMWAMSEGLFVYRVADGRLLHLGEGAHPRFDETGRWLVFDRTEDDGHTLTAGELFLADLERDTVAPLTASADLIEHMPTLAAGRLAFATPEGVLAGRLVLE